MSAKYKRMVVHRNNRRSGGSPDMGEDGFTSGVRANTAEIGIMERRLGVLVKGRMLGSVPISVEILSS